MKPSEFFKKLLESESETTDVKVNNIMHLRRQISDYAGNPVDRLEVIFDDPIGSFAFFTKEINSRDTQGILNEIAEAVSEYSQKWTEEHARRILGGLLK